MNKIVSHVIVLIAFATNNRGGKMYDVFGRSYRQVYKMFGHTEMVREYRTHNSWRV